MTPGDDTKPESTENDPEQLSRLLEIELMQKRFAWQQARTRQKTVKLASFFFLFVVIVAALVGFYLFFSQVKEQRTNQPGDSTPAPATR